ncbi:MAG: hypothetical protein H6814_09090 [Phycisphaeraceae bacterium]|nr:hypothetical protein [Phycisphaeraceae bacterium]
MPYPTRNRSRSGFNTIATLLCAVAWLCSASRSPADVITICTFNVYKLGAVDPKYEDLEFGDGEEIPQRILNLADVLTVDRFDLICLQEVYAGARGEAVIDDLVQALDTRHGLRYRSLLSEHIGRGLMPEAIAFLYDPAVVRPLPVGSAGQKTENIPIPGRDLVKTAWVAGDFDFTLVAAHLAWGDEDDRDAGYRQIREILTDPASFSGDPDVLVLGDFNRFGKGFSSVDFLDHHPGEFFVPNIQFFDPAVHERKTVTKSSITGKGVPDDDPQLLSTTVAPNRYVYDMVLFTPDAAEEYTAGSAPGSLGVDFGIVYFDEPGRFGHQPGADSLGHNELKEAYSDHRPLFIRFFTDTGNADGETPTVAATTEFVGTQSGTRFHLPGCRTIRNSVITERWATAEDALADRRACGVCKPLQNSGL